MYRLIQRGQEGASWPRPDDMPPLIHQLLLRRGVASAEEAQAFLHPDETQLHDPFLFPGMAEAVARIRQAKEKGETVCVWGDYDVDGVSATAILMLYFASMGLPCFHYIPDRHAEGYGLNDNGIREVAKRASLLITVDCGISCAHEIETAKSLGLDAIVTDHHRPGDVLPDCTVINPLIRRLGQWSLTSSMSFFPPSRSVPNLDSSPASLISISTGAMIPCSFALLSISSASFSLSTEWIRETLSIMYLTLFV